MKKTTIEFYLITTINSRYMSDTDPQIEKDIQRVKAFCELFQCDYNDPDPISYSLEDMNPYHLPHLPEGLEFTIRHKSYFERLNNFHIAISLFAELYDFKVQTRTEKIKNVP